jgi:fatty acyl-CoA reductase
MIRDFYANKAVFLTGTTGFIGKVVLEKFISSLPEVRKIYVLVRPKKGTTALDRVRKDIFSS